MNGVSGFANPGELTVIMGSSGAGKTSLLNIIAGRIKNQANTKISGLVSANGKPISTIDFKKYCAFVRQEDLLLPFLTVKETLLYAGLLKINKPRNEIDQLVDKLLIDLRLNTVSENKIGNYMYKGISGGERKRVSVGVELISEPQIIILDEPTSGLDSFTAELIIDMLKDLGKQGKTIIATIHQPSSNLFEKFQKLILLSEGNVVYHGSAAKSRKYFTNLGFRCPRLVNPPDYYMRILHITNRYNQTDEESTRLETLIEAYKKIEPKNENPILAELNKVKYESANESKKLMTLIKRQFTNRRRDPTPSRQNFIFYALTSLLADLIYGRLGNDFKALQDIRGVLYFITLIHVMVGNARGSLEFPFERGNFLREKEQGFYNTLVYLSAKMIAEVPLQLATVLLASVLIYFPIGLNLTFEKFCLFYLIALLSNLMGVGIGYCIGALSPNLQTAVQMGPLVLSPLSVYGGFLVNVDKMNVAFR